MNIITMPKEVLGVIEKARIIGLKGEEEVKAIVDTGAKLNSLDSRLAERVGIGKPIRTMKVKNPSLKGHVMRPVVSIKIEIKGRVFETEANIQDRSHMKFPVIIGRNLMVGNFVVDPEVHKEEVAGGQ